MNDQPITPTEAQAAIAADKQRRMLAFRAAIEAAAAEFECDLIASPRFTQDGRTVGVLEIIAR